MTTKGPTIFTFQANTQSFKNIFTFQANTQSFKNIFLIPTSLLRVSQAPEKHHWYPHMSQYVTISFWKFTIIVKSHK